MRRTWLTALVVLCFGFGCRPMAPPGPGRALQPSGPTVAKWEPVVVGELPQAVAPPWGGTWGERVEVWGLEPLELDRPEVNSWLEGWRRGEGKAGRRLPLAPPPGSQALPISEPGAYVVRAWDGRAWRAALVLASPLTLTLTLSDDDLEVFCAESRTGRPVQGAFVKAVYRTTWRGRERVLSASGTTDSSGRWHAAVVRDRFARLIVATAVAAQGKNYALANARRAIEPKPPVELSVRARRAVVRPGQRAEVTGRVARLTEGRALPVGNVPVKLWLVGPDEVPLATATVRTGPVGTFSAIFRLPEDARAGAYEIAAAAEGAARCYPRRFRAFEVVPLAPEPFSLKVTTSAAILAPGEELRVEVEATDARDRPLPGVTIRTLSYGYPVELQGNPRWLTGRERIEPERLVAQPIALDGPWKTDGNGKASLRWRPSRAELPEENLLCGVKVRADAGSLGVVTHTVEAVVLAEPPLVSIEPPRLFARPGQTVKLAFHSPLSPADQGKVGARCELSYDDAGLSRHRFTIFAGTVAGLAANRLEAVLSQPGRYEFVVRAGRSASRSVVWAVAKGADIPWGGANAPAMVFERPWARAGEKLLAVVAARSAGSPVALTLRKRSGVERRLVEAPKGARCIEVSLSPGDRGPLEARLAQVAGGGAARAATRLPIEPGGGSLQVATSLMWVRKGEWSGRGYKVRTEDAAGRAVQSVAAPALVRPTFRGCPPAEVGATFVLSHAGKATSRGGELEVGFHEALLGRAAGMFVEALSPEGRRGAFLAPLYATSPALELPAGRERTPGERLAAIAEYGLDDPTARWLARCLVEQSPEAAEAVPRLIGSARSGAEVVALMRLAASGRAAGASLAAALRSEKSERAAVVAASAPGAPRVRAILERLLSEDRSAGVRAAAARALGRVATRSLPALSAALREDKAARVRAAAAEALGSAGRGALDVLAAAAARERVPEVCVAAAGSLGRLGGIQALLSLLTRREPSVVRAALRALDGAGYGGLDSRLVRLLRSRDETVASLAARLVLRGGQEGIRSVVRATRGRPREGLVRVLAEGDSPEVAAAMRRWVRHEDPSLRLVAGEWLARRGDELGRAALREFLGETALAEQRDRAAAALVAAKDVTSLPRLVALARKGKIGLGAMTSLLRRAGQLGWQEVAPLVVEVLWRGVAHPERLTDRGERELWIAAADAAPSVGPLWTAQTEALAGAVPAECPYREALTAMKREGVGAFMAALWASPLPDELRCHAVVAFARLEGKASAARLVGLLDSPVFQRSALGALIELGAAEALRGGLRDGSPVVRASCAAALGAIADPASVPRLRRLLEDRDPFVRMEAAHALATITGEAVFYGDHLGEQRLATP